MNDFDYKIEPKGNGFVAKMRTARDGAMRPLVGKKGKPIVFVARAAAAEALLTNLCAFVNGHYERDGEIAGHTAAAANAVFRIIKQKGRTRQITVVTNRRPVRG